MNILNKLKEKLSFFDVIIILSPFLDLIICQITKLGKLSYLGSLLRGGLLLAMIIYVFFSKKPKNKKALYYILALIFFIFSFLLNKLLLFPENIFAEIISIIKYMFFPLMTACLLVFYDENNIHVENSFYITALIYGFFLLFPLLIGSNYSSYSYVKNGNLGWFYSGNEISAITSLLCPFVILKSLEAKAIKNKVIFGIISILYIYSIFTIGTKIPVIATFITLILLIFGYVFLIFKDKKSRKNHFVNIILLIIITMASTFLMLFGDTLSNVIVQGNVYQEKNPSNSETTNNGSSNNGSNSNNKPPVILKPGIMDNYSNIMHTYFDDEEEQASYKTNKILNLIFSSRDIYLFEGFQRWKEANLSEKLLGLGHVQYSEGKPTTKLVEMDVFDVFFHYGIIGFILYYGLVIYFAFVFLIYFFKNIKGIFKEPSLYIKLISIAIIIFLSSIAGHYFGAPAVSFLCALLFATLFKKIKKVKNEDEKFWTKRLIILLVIITGFISLLCFINSRIYKNYENIKIEFNYNNGKYELKNKDMKMNLLESKKINSNYAKDELKYYSISHKNKVIANILVINRSFDNEIAFTYLTGKNVTGSDLDINITNSIKYEEYYDFSKDKIEKEYSTTVGYDKLSLPDKYITLADNNGSQINYKFYIYNLKENNYDKNNYSILKDLITEINSKGTGNNVLKTAFRLGTKQYFDNLVINSNEKIFKNQEDLEAYINTFNSGLTSAWLSFDGTYAKLPYSISPYTKEGYGRNLKNQTEKGFKRLYSENSSNDLYKNYVLSSIHVLEKYIPRYTNGVWLTEYTSTWLQKDYGIKALYFDTRHNDTLAEYFRDLGEFYNDDYLKELSTYYADYLVLEYKNNNVVNLKEGVLSPDYYSTHHKKVTHASLNHQLAIINYLLTTYLQTNNNEYKDLALTYLNTITKIGANWIKENGDLHYEIKPNGAFHGTDYEQLTLEDLLRTQDLLKKVVHKKSPELDVLIRSKYKYLKSINANINQIILEYLKEGGYVG